MPLGHIECKWALISWYLDLPKYVQVGVADQLLVSVLKGAHGYTIGVRSPMVF